MFRSLLLALVSAVAVVGQERSIPVLTVCEVLDKLETYGGQSVIVVGRVANTMEGVWIDEACGLTVTRGDLEFRPSIWITWVSGQDKALPQLPVNFKWNDAELNTKLQQVKSTTTIRVKMSKKGGEMWGAFFGRLEAELPPCQKNGDRVTCPIPGFGHLNGSPAQLVSLGDGFRKLR